MPLGAPLLVLRQHEAQHVGVEAAAQALVGRDDDRADALHRLALHEERVLVLGVGLGDVHRDAATRARRRGATARIRSWAFFIFEAATISIALVILRVLCTLLILLRISLEPAIRSFRAIAAGIADARCARHLTAASRSVTSRDDDQYVPVFLKSSIAAASAFSSSAVMSLVCSILSISAAYLLFMNWRSAASNASALSTGTSS